MGFVIEVDGVDFRRSDRQIISNNRLGIVIEVAYVSNQNGIVMKEAITTF